MINYTSDIRVNKFEYHGNGMRRADDLIVPVTKLGIRLVKNEEIAVLNVTFHIDADIENGDSFEIDIWILNSFKHGNIRPEVNDLLQIIEKASITFHEVLFFHGIKNNVPTQGLNPVFSFGEIVGEIALELDECFPL